MTHLPATLVRVVAVMLTVTVGCTTRPPRNSHPSAADEPPVSSDLTVPVADFTILQASGVNLGRPGVLKPEWTWEPAKHEVSDALGRVPDFLKSAVQTPPPHAAYGKQLPGLLARLPETLCQAYGISTEGGAQGIFLNFLPVRFAFDFDARDWRWRFVKVYDGGPEYWSVRYLPNTRTFANLHVDRGY